MPIGRTGVSIIKSVISAKILQWTDGLWHWKQMEKTCSLSILVHQFSVTMYTDLDCLDMITNLSRICQMQSAWQSLWEVHVLILNQSVQISSIFSEWISKISTFGTTRHSANTLLRLVWMGGVTQLSSSSISIVIVHFVRLSWWFLDIEHFDFSTVASIWCPIMEDKLYKIYLFLHLKNVSVWSIFLHVDSWNEKSLCTSTLKFNDLHLTGLHLITFPHF